MTSVSFDENNGKAVVAFTSPKSYGDLQLIDVKNGDGSQLTFYNTSYFKEHPPATLRKSSFDRAGFDIQARVWFPPEFDESRKYPLILDIHGGPNGCFYDTFTPVQHILATAGYVVLAVNPRGSSSYGLEFTMAVLGDWGGEDYQDLMMAVDELVDRPYIDESRLGVYGYSYGGFMSSWVVGHTDRFKAAVIGAPCINLSSMYGTSDIGISFGERQWGGLRKDALDKYMERSPLTYASNVTTPVLLMHGEADYRVPIEQGEQFFVTLKRLGKEIEFVRFPDSAHGFVRLGHPKLRVEYLARVLGWFEKHLE